MFLGSIELSTAVTEHQGFHGTQQHLTGYSNHSLSSARHDWIIVCGTCDIAMSYHPINNDFVTCERSQDTFPNTFTINTLERSDYYLNTVTGEVMLVSDYSGYADSNEEPDEYVSADVEIAAIDNWRDVTYDAYNKTWVSTTTLEQHQKGYFTEALIDGEGDAKPYSSQDEYDSDRNAYVEGHEGFIAKTYINELLTRKYHERLLNVFRDKRTGTMRIGGIAIERQGDHIIASCVNSRCNAKLSINPSHPDLTREHMQQFVMDVIRHGNNHAANWFRSRDTYYKVHAAGCDIHRCDPNVPWCKVVTVPPVEDTTDVTMILDHNSKCRNPNCNCESWLTSEVPSLKVGA